MRANPKFEPLTNNTQITQQKTATKREEGRSLGSSPHTAKTLPPTLVKNSLHYSALASQQTTSSTKS